MFLKNQVAVIVLLFFQASLFAQKENIPVTKEFSIITENDNYNFTQQDRYYTNGFFVKFNWLQKNKTNNAVKTINRVEAGQMVFNSYSNRRSSAEVLTKMDRPYAAWLYASAGKTKIFSKKNVLMYDVSVGILGPSARGKEVQTGYHHFVGLYKVYGWEYQLNNEAGVNASVQYYHSLLKPSAKHISVHAVGKATLGNTFTNASAGVLLKFGRIKTDEQSAYWSSRLGSVATGKRNNFESVFFLEPSMMAQAYNATVQGGLFSTDKGYYVSTLNPFICVMKGGAIFSWKKTAFSIIYTVKQREARSMIDKAEVYGAFGLAFRFR
ncbi:MAG: lipid A deacylase LpxR family protein [Lacibacter sp.]